ncbi:MAG: hypothetical protein CNE98_07630 [Bacteroidetes bacterium MED-G17]|nr:MAG: hypothetical protein CNE98_07630 [Bacteroidetes bacterium MED-G17]CAI8272321.1 MAG: Uncharacterised protein [Bacteroidetes bacterium MED-G17]|tara:strand:- start:5934 stop:6248 length:315 start_codon:yes stop_codon:yes gene_type:complete
MLSISQRVVKILTHYKLNNAQLAQKLNVSPPVVTHLKSGRNKPSFDMLVQLSNSFPDIDLRWLVHGEGDMIDHKNSQVDDIKAKVSKNLELIDKVSEDLKKLLS